MPGRMVTLCSRRLGEAEYDLMDCLQSWREKLGDRLYPVLRRDRLLPVLCTPDTEDDQIRFLLKTCVIRGNPPKTGASRLDKELLQRASPELLSELYEERTVLPQEDLSALLEYCGQQVRRQSQEKRTVLLAYGQKKVIYDL